MNQHLTNCEGTLFNEECWEVTFAGYKVVTDLIDEGAAKNTIMAEGHVFNGWVVREAFVRGAIWASKNPNQVENILKFLNKGNPNE